MSSPRPDRAAVTLAGAGRRHGLALVERLIDRLPFVEKEMLLIRRLVQPGWICIDVGAAGGTYTHLLARRVQRRGHVHAIEPRAASMRHLLRLRRWLRWENVTLHQVALTDRVGHAELVIPRVVQTEAHLAPADGTAPARRATTVATTTLDELVTTHGLARLDLLACDVEGAELRLLAGAEGTIRRFRPIVVCEIEHRHLRRYGADPAEVLDWFRLRGYRPYRVHAGALLPVDRVVVPQNDYVLWPDGRALPRR